MGGPTWGAAIDYLVARLLDPMRAVDTEVHEIADNEPTLSSTSTVVIGRHDASSGAAGAGSNQYLELGAARIEESYTIPGYIDVYRPGPAQKPARDAAVALLTVLIEFLHADPTLGGLLQRGRIAELARVTYQQTQDDEDTAGGGYRRCVIDVEIQVHNSYIPG